jgi:NADPH2:quinone reductase
VAAVEVNSRYNKLHTVMRAIQFAEVGPSSVLKLVKVPIPSFTPKSIIIANKAAGVNFIDTYHRSGLYTVDLPYIPGREAAGVIDQIDPSNTKFKKGDRVAYLSPGTYSEYTALNTGL